MKTKLPLPNETNALPVSKEVVQNLGYPFCNVDVFCKVAFTQKDVDYIKNEIQSNKLYGIVHSNKGFTLRSMLTIIQFYNSYINDTKCPKNVRRFLDAYIADIYRGIQNIKAENEVMPTNFMINRWMRTCR
jgi:hypothetical protein